MGVAGRVLEGVGTDVRFGERLERHIRCGHGGTGGNCAKRN